MDTSVSSISSIDLSTRSTTNLVDENENSVLDASSPRTPWKAFSCVMEEYERRFPHFLTTDYSDFLQAPNKTISASTFMFFATIFSTIALGVHLSEVGDSGEYMGVSEYLIMNSLSGLYFSVMSCQPLMILRPTGPITMIIENIIIISEKYHINFWHLLACSGYFVGLWMTLIAAFQGCSKIGLLTRFTHEIFSFYVCSIYIYNGVNDVVTNFVMENDDGTDSFGKSVFMAVLAVLAFSISLVLSSCDSRNNKNSYRDSDDSHPVSAKERILSRVILKVHAEEPNAEDMSGSDLGDRSNLWSTLSAADTTDSDSSCSRVQSGDDDVNCVAVKWNICTPQFRSIINDYAVTVAVFVVTLLSCFPIWFSHTTSIVQSGALSVDRVSVPSGLTPTMTERSWLVSFTNQAYESFYSNDQSFGHIIGEDKFVMIAMAFAISIPIVFFFYIDQNLSCILSQAPHIDGMKGGKGTYVHSPFLCVALSNLVGPSFGLPFVTASLPHSPQFALALTVHKNYEDSTNSKDAVSSTSENRVAPVLVYSLIGLVSFMPSVIRNIPLGAVRGVLAYVGFAGILNTELWQRLVMCTRPLPISLVIPSLTPSPEKSTITLSFQRIHAYTLLQVCILVFFWILNMSPEPIGLLVAFGVAALGPMRLYWLPLYFSPEELLLLDS